MEALLARSAFLGEGARSAFLAEGDDVEVSITPPTIQEDISASMEALLARSAFLGDGDDVEVSNTPPSIQEDAVTMCTLPFTQSQSPVPVVVPHTTPGCSSSKDPECTTSEVQHNNIGIMNQRARPRVCTRKARGARIRTPTPSPERITSEVQHSTVDPLYRAVLMIPTQNTPPVNPDDFLALARQRGFI
ncbi:hypothetical protein GUJ93_ZPchr0012g21699 [Zizania palustris]|uniref:Uncharacterized protein n=1 Tax=Zizania palustris TaxID=103762 RepID=A0A8J6BRA3_ZIZPA|nr:hypothetical protein GUJ93_ZPchr0012g21699 [Zizania palustris]